LNFPQVSAVADRFGRRWEDRQALFADAAPDGQEDRR
jgi:hypothetical protein